MFTRLVIKELLELYGNRNILLLLFILPIFLLYLSGNVRVSSTKFKVFVEPNKYSSPTNHKISSLFSEFNSIKLIDSLIQIDDDIINQIERHHIDIYFRWYGIEKGYWTAFTSQTGGVRRGLLKAYTNQLFYLINSIDNENIQESEPIENVFSYLNLLNQSDLVELYPPNHKNELALVSRVIALICIFIAFWLSSSTFIREKESFTLESLLVASRISWNNIFVIKILVISTLSIFNLFTLIIFAESFFGIGIKTNFWPMLFMMTIAILSSSFLGLIVSLKSKSKWNASFISAFYLICLILFTGLSFPLTETSSVIQFLSNFLPLSFSLEPFKAWIERGVSTFFFSKEWFFLLIQCFVYGCIALFLLNKKNKIY